MSHKKEVINKYNTYLGFDLSTQKLKAVLLNSKLEVTLSSEVKYDVDLPEYDTTGGAIKGEQENEYAVPTVMWVKALDIVLNSLKSQGADMSTIVALSGSSQQHGSIYWSRYGIRMLKTLNAKRSLHQQINDSAFEIKRSPIWMDGSTQKQCTEMENVVGGPLAMATITGSKCYPRFTGPQIRKIYQQLPDAYVNTERISLVSSFLASLLLGDVAPIDYSDASGMNLFDIREKRWSKICLDSCAPDLHFRLMKPIESNGLVGRVSQYYVQRYGFRPDCMIAPCTGDNPSALAGMMIDKNCLVLSLGTSDTIIMHLLNPPSLEEGHVLCHPTETKEYMGLLCFQNGSLVREALLNEFANGSWNKFNELLENAPRGNNGNMALHFHDLEIIPSAKGTLRWNKTHARTSPDASAGAEKFDDPSIEIRALIEGQMLHHRSIAADMGFGFESNTKIIAIGGGSVNKHLLQVVSDVFNAPVYVQKESEAALMGAAYRARYAFYLFREAGCNCKRCKTPPLSYHNFIAQFIPSQFEEVCKPNLDSDKIYEPMLERYQDMAQILEKSSKRLSSL